MKSVILKSKVYNVELIKTSTIQGKQFPFYKLVGPKATYYTFPYLNHEGKHYIVDEKSKVSGYMKAYTFISDKEGNVSVK